MSNFELFSILIFQVIIMCLGNMIFISFNKWKTYCSILMLFLPLIVLFYTKYSVLTTGFIWFIMCLVSYYLLKDFFYTVYFVSISLLTYILSDYLVGFLLSILEFETSPFVRMFMSAGLNILAILAVKKFNEKYVAKKSMMVLSILASMTFLVYFIIISVERYANIPRDMEKTNLLLLLIYGCISIIVSVISIRYFKQKYKNKELENELVYLKRMSLVTEDHYKEVKKFRHDYNNVILSLESFISEQNWEGLEQYYYDSLKQRSKTLQSNFPDITQMNNLKISEIKGIIMDKLCCAASRSVKVSIDIPDVIEDLALQKLDLVRIIGILLDNSLEETNNKQGGTIDLLIYKEKNSTYFILTNSIHEEKNLPLFELKKQGVSTKGTGRGMGLANLDEIIAKYENISLETKLDQYRFTQIVSIINKGDVSDYAKGVYL